MLLVRTFSVLELVGTVTDLLHELSQFTGANMVVYIGAVRVDPSTSNHHGHITVLWWYTSDNNTLKPILKQELVNWLNTGPNHRAFVQSVTGEVEVHVVKGNPPFVQTAKDGIWTNNLLALRRM